MQLWTPVFVVLIVIGMVCSAWGAQAVVIDTVPVGNPGNAADTETGYGAVAYEYNIGKYEVTAGQYTEFLNKVAATDTYGLYNTSMDSNSYGCQITRLGSSGNYTYDFSGRPSGTEADWANRPVGYVSWGDAARFANWLTNGQPTGGQGLTTTEDGSYYLNGATSNSALLAVMRIADGDRTPGKKYYFIPSEDEWYKAAYYDPNKPAGAGYWDYPTGTDATPIHHLLTPDPGNNANFQIADGDYTIGDPYWRTPVGEFENSESPYGTFDQGGNVWEWNEAILYGSYRGDRGGSFVHEDEGMLPAYRHYNFPAAETPTVGFRVSGVPEPATMSLLALGGLALAARRRGRK